MNNFNYRQDKTNHPEEKPKKITKILETERSVLESLAWLQQVTQEEINNNVTREEADSHTDLCCKINKEIRRILEIKNTLKPEIIEKPKLTPEEMTKELEVKWCMDVKNKRILRNCADCEEKNICILHNHK